MGAEAGHDRGFLPATFRCMDAVRWRDPYAHKVVPPGVDAGSGSADGHHGVRTPAFSRSRAGSPVKPFAGFGGESEAAAGADCGIRKVGLDRTTCRRRGT